eukprot:m.200117 g.200117  ORF g.200117 m.200117 type:complete len:418 (+) comp20960_c0_seq1:77-1330(+)
MGLRRCLWLLVLVSGLVNRGCHGKATCDVCTSFVTKFHEGMAKTRGKSSGSGNTDWEETRGIKYSTSEARLIEVIDGACDKSNMKCLQFLEEHEEFLEDWFIGNTIDLKDMRRLLCVDHTKLCCEEGFYGKACKPCPGGSVTPCSSHGTCQGSGDRKGKGKCKCDTGYIGKRCAQCASMHFKNGSEAAYDCQKCDAACATGCSGPARTDCVKCAAGYDMSDAEGCVDVDECAAGNFNCSERGVFCSNTDGSYTCEKCDPACHPDDGCVGPGPLKCVDNSCADGYQHTEESGCIDINECNDETKQCSDTAFCTNTPGSFHCTDCSDVCAPGSGCTDATPLGCKQCGEGYKVPEGRDIGCEDIDECAGDDTRCREGYTCLNTAGSFACECRAPNVEADGVCAKPTEGDGGEPTGSKEEL